MRFFSLLFIFIDKTTTTTTTYYYYYYYYYYYSSGIRCIKGLHSTLSVSTNMGRRKSSEAEREVVTLQTYLQGTPPPSPLVRF